MTLLIAFPLQVIVSYFILHSYYWFPTISLLICCLVVISWALTSIIPVIYTPLS
jgi:hypothetical protein